MASATDLQPNDFNPTESAMPRPLPAALLSLAAASMTLASAAHDWNSPAQPATPPGWSGRLWAGPSAGVPAMPTAADCHRAPEPFELDGPEPPQPQRRRPLRPGDRPHAGFGAEAGPAEAPAATGVDGALALRSERAERDARDALEERDARADRAKALAARERAAGVVAAPPPPPSPAPTGAPLRQAAPAEPVTAGVVDDNADFGAYLAFRARHRDLPVHDRDVSERYRLTVHDARGRPVPDADVRLYAAGREQPLWARTDAGGQVWLHPRAAGLAGEVFEVRASRPGNDGLMQGRAYLRRGQRDALQITLDAADRLPPARLDLVFLVDATGSMADEIHKLRASMQSMADQIASLPSRPSTCYGLVAYRDRGDAFFVRGLDFTDDLAAFQRGLAGLQADGGGDTPEALNEALHTAVHRLSWRDGGATRLVVLVADAPPHLDYGHPWYDEDMQAALARGIKLLPIGASGLDRSGEFIFRQLAQYTGGRFVFLTYADARRPASGPGRETVHEVDNYSVETLDKLVVRLVREELARRPG